MDPRAVDIVAVTHTAARARNEDTISVGPWIWTGTHGAPVALTFTPARDEPLPVIVADGLGGHPAGDIASRLAVTAFATALGARAIPEGGLESVIADALLATNELLYRHMRGNAELEAMGSTAAGVVVLGDEVGIFNVGDSRVYRWRDGALVQLTIDDHVALEGRPGLLSQALGGSKDAAPITPHVFAEPRTPGTVYLVCSDGLSTPVDDATIVAAMAAPMPVAVATLLEAALASGHGDNISIVLARIS